jgi:hypothetical protein
MGRRKDGEIEAIVDAIEIEIQNLKRQDVLTVSANEIAREFDIHPNTATMILRQLGLDFDGVYWYWVKKNDDE